MASNRPPAPKRSPTSSSASAMPLVVHQGVEYALAAGLVFFALHSDPRTTFWLLGVAGATGALAALTAGGLGMVRVIPARGHPAAEVVVAVGAVAAAVATGNLLRLDVIVPVVLAAVV